MTGRIKNPCSASGKSPPHSRVDWEVSAMNFASSLQGHYRPRIFVLSLLGLIATSPAFAQSPPKYSAKVPPSIQTPDTVQTRIGTLKFSDGLPDEDTVTEGLRPARFRRAAWKRSWRACRRPRSMPCARALARGLQVERGHRRHRKPGRRALAISHARTRPWSMSGFAPTSRTGRWSCRCRPACSA